MSLDINNVTVTFGKQSVLNDLTLPTIHCGEMVALIGKNGAGKSTLLRQMTALLKQYPEQIRYLKKPLFLPLPFSVSCEELQSLLHCFDPKCP